MGAHGRHVHPTPEVTIDYFAAGDGPAVVLVHGITESRRTWDPLVAPLIGAGYRVVAIDLRGHGDSSRIGPYDLATMAGDVGLVLATEGIEDGLLVGHSLGGAVVSACAAGGPCTGVVNVDQPLALGGFQQQLRDLEPMLRGDGFDAAIEGLFDAMAGPLVGAERWRVEHGRAADRDVVLGVWDAVLTSDASQLDAMVAAVAGAITVPYLSLHGIDPGPHYAPWLGALVPTATVETWADHGHYPHLVDPDRFVTRVVEFDPR